MRTILLLLATAISLAGTTASLAQVYSVNAVAGVPLVLRPGFNLIQNPLDAAAIGGNVVSNVLAGVPDGTTVYRYTNAPAGNGYIVNDYTTLFGWTDPKMSMAPGEGVFVWLPPGPDFANVFIGDVMQGQLVTELPAGFSMIGSKVPQAGKLAINLEFPPSADGDTVFQYYVGFGYWTSYYDLEGWQPAEPTIAVGEAFWIEIEPGKTWVRNFDVNAP